MLLGLCSACVLRRRHIRGLLKGLHLVEAAVTDLVKRPTILVAALQTARGVGVMNRLVANIELIAKRGVVPSSLAGTAQKKALYRLFPSGVSPNLQFLNERVPMRSNNDLAAMTARAQSLVAGLVGTDGLLATATTVNTAAEERLNVFTPVSAFSAWRDLDDPASLVRSELPPDHECLQRTYFSQLSILSTPPSSEPSTTTLQEPRCKAAEHILRCGCTTSLLL